MWHTKVFLFRYLALIYALLIFAVSAIPQINPPSLGFEFGDKILHFGEYGIFSFLLFLAFSSSKKEFFNKNVFLLCCLVGVAYAISDELHQKFVQGRSCEFFDFLADSLGIVVVQMSLRLHLRRKSHPSNKS